MMPYFDYGFTCNQFLMVSSTEIYPCVCTYFLQVSKTQDQVRSQGVLGETPSLQYSVSSNRWAYHIQCTYCILFWDEFHLVPSSSLALYLSY